MDQYKFDDSVIESGRGKGKQRHVHLLNGAPLLGTSTVLSVLNKNGLTWWASGLAVGHLGWTPINEKYVDENGEEKTRPAPVEPRIKAAGDRFAQIVAMSTEEYLATLDEAYRAHSVKLDTSAEAGTDMHAELESYVKLCIGGNNGKPVPDHSGHIAVELFSKWSMANVARFIASEAYCYSKSLWTGGIVDLVYQDKDGRYALLDFKSAKEAYDAHFLQNAGYDIAIRENGIFTKDGESLDTLTGEQAFWDADGFLRYSVLPFGMREPTVIHKDNVIDYRQGFIACVTLHKLFDIGKSKF